MKIDTIMNEKLEILRELIGNCVFASSPSSLAGTLGYKGKMGIYRIAKGEASSRTIEEVWARLLTEFSLTYDDLFELVRIFRGAKCLEDNVDTRNKDWGDKIILALIKEEYDFFSDEFIEEAIPILQDMQENNAEVFYGMLALLYIRYKKIEPYKADFTGSLYSLLDNIDRLLSAHCPENRIAQFVADRLKSRDLMRDTSNSLWGMIDSAKVLLHYYFDPSYRKEAMKMMQLFNWGNATYWLEPGAVYEQGSVVWFLVEEVIDSPLHGCYTAIKLVAGKNTESFIVENCLHFAFWAIGAENDYPILQVIKNSELATRCQMECYLYEYNEKNKQIEISWNEHANKFNLPPVLQIVDFQNPATRNEKVWARILSKFREEKEEECFLQAIKESTGVEVLYEYEIIDVVISRTNLTIIVEYAEGELCEYQLPVSTYSFLSEITPRKEVLITRHRGSDTLYFEWIEPNCYIKMSEFEKIEGS